MIHLGLQYILARGPLARQRRRVGICISAKKIYYGQVVSMSVPFDSSTALPLHEKVYQNLSNALMQGEFHPGQKLTLRALADELGTSISPIREAISRLAALKAVQVFPKRYILVTPLSAELYMEIVEIRKLLEGHAAARACARMTPEDINKLAIINKRLLQYAQEGQTRLAMKDNHAFHFAVYKNAGSTALLESIEQIWLRVGPSVNQLLAEEFARDETSLTKGFDHHQKLIQALRARDTAGALGAITGDIDVSADYLLDGLRRQSDSSSATLGILNSGKGLV
jgi:DNA-binding GntR family transcriptional regulator